MHDDRARGRRTFDRLGLRADARVHDRVEPLARNRIVEDDARERGPVDGAGRVDDLRPGRRDLALRVGPGRHGRARELIRVDDHGTTCAEGRGDRTFARADTPRQPDPQRAHTHTSDAGGAVASRLRVRYR